MNAPDLLRAGGWRQRAADWVHDRYGPVRFEVSAALADELAHVSRERDRLEGQLEQALALLQKAGPALLEGAKELRKVVVARSQGLSIVDAKDRAVLDAMAAVPRETLERSLSNLLHADEHSRAPAAAELARRGHS